MDSGGISKKEYLKKYLSGGDKKKKKKKSTQSLIIKSKIVDDDIDLKNMRPIDDDELEIFDLGEEAPQIVGIVDERPEEIRIMSEYRSTKKWKIVTDEFGIEDVKITAIDRRKSDEGSPKREKEISIEIRKNSERDASDSDNSPPRNRENESDQVKKTSKKEVVSDSKPLLTERLIKKEKDASPPRKPRKENYDSDASPPRRVIKVEKDSDSSPPRKKQQADDSDISPPRRRRKDDSDESPPRRKKKVGSDVSPPRKRQKDDSDTSPPRRKRKDDSDSSPPRRKQKYDSDSSPPRRRKHRDESGTSSHRSNTVNNKYDSESSSKPRRNESDRHSRLSSETGRRRRSTSPAVVESSKKSEGYGLKVSASNFDSNKPKKSSQLEKTLSGKKAGLQSAEDMKKENEKLKRKEKEMFEKMSDEVTGKHATAIVRNRKTGQRHDPKEEARKKREKEEKEAEKIAQYAVWGKGVKQVQDRQEKIKDDLYEMSKPLARYKDDKDLEGMLRNKEDEEDPMLEYMRKKKKSDLKTVKPEYKGSYMPNRYDIKPGHKWDGVDRSNGYEKKWFEEQNAKKAREEEAFKWSTIDM